MSEEDPNHKRKRAAKRYIYSLPAVCDVEGTQPFDIQILNISTSGVQFASRTKIETKNPIKLIWTDPGSFVFEASFQIAREIIKPENKDFQYYYGSQYYNLEDDVKNRLLLLLRKFREDDKQKNQEQLEKITPQYLLKIVQDDDFLKKVFAGEPISRYFDGLIKEVKEYEKSAFEKQDEFSKCIQRLTTLNFHFNLLGMLTAFAVENKDLEFTFFRHIQTELEKVTESENQVDMMTGQIFESHLSDDEKKGLQKTINESNNRLFYTKQGLVQSVVETFINVDSESPEYIGNFGKIKEEYDKIIEFTNGSYYEVTQPYARRSRKPKGFSKADSIVDLPIKAVTKTRYFLWINTLLVFIFASAFIAVKLREHDIKINIKDKIGLEIEVKEYKHDGAQSNIVVSGKEWKSLPMSYKLSTFEKIIQFLREDDEIKSMTVYDDQYHIIKILFKDSKIATSSKSVSPTPPSVHAEPKPVPPVTPSETAPAPPAEEILAH